MSEEKPPKPPASVVSKPRRSVPLVTTIIVTCLAVAVAAEGFYIYLQRYQIMEFQDNATNAGDEIAKLRRELQQTNYSLQRYYQLVGPGDLGDLEERVRSANPPTLRGYISQLEARLQTTVSKLDELQAGWDSMNQRVQEAVKAKAAAQAQLTQKTEEFARKLEGLTARMEAQRKDHQKALAALQAKVADLEKRLRDEEKHSDELAAKYNQEHQARRQLEAWYRQRLNKVRTLLAQALGVPLASVGLSEALLAADRLQIPVAAAESAAGLSYVRFEPPPGRKLEVGMRFIIYDRQGRWKCTVRLTNVETDKVLGLVEQTNPESGEPVRAGDLALLDLAYEELRSPPAPPSLP